MESTGVGIRMSADPNKKTIPGVALVAMKTGVNKVGFKFVDCVAEYVDEKIDALHPDGYGEAKADKYGVVRTQGSHVAGLVGGSTEVVIFPAQFGIPCPHGTEYRFWAGPQQFIDACVRAVVEELCPPDYVI
jgi:hypothetical protein